MLCCGRRAVVVQGSLCDGNSISNLPVETGRLVAESIQRKIHCQLRVRAIIYLLLFGGIVWINFGLPRNEHVV